MRPPTPGDASPLVTSMRKTQPFDSVIVESANR